MKSKYYNIFCKIFGKVQGVGYRAWTKKSAEKHYLTGWVKNCDDKTVECEVSGLEENLQLFLKDCSIGPLLSSVKKVQSKKKPFTRFSSFIIYFK